MKRTYLLRFRAWDCGIPTHDLHCRAVQYRPPLVQYGQYDRHVQDILSVYLPICLCLSLPVCLSLSACLSVSLCLPAYLSLSVSDCLSIYLPGSLSLSLSGCLPACLSMCLSQRF
jgi:hypothetical protein